MSPKAKHVLAREHLNRGLAGVAADDYAEAVSWLFLALEAAIVAVADKHGIDTHAQHWRKAEVAAELHATNLLPHDFSSTLRLLNDARKVANYDRDEPDLEDSSLEDIAANDLVRSWSNNEAWHRRLRTGREDVERHLPIRLRPLHETVLSRARRAGAHALILSGSTARGRRTQLSDLDYHLVGSRIETNDLSHELDLHVLSKAKLDAEILDGDDFVQWSLRFGCILFDDGAVRHALRLIAEAGLPAAANALRSTIERQLSPDDLTAAVDEGRRLLSAIVEPVVRA